MKCKIISISFMLIVCLLFSGCDGYLKDIRYDLTFENNADYSISIYSLLIPPYYLANPIVYPDTSLPIRKPLLNMEEIRPHGFRVYGFLSEDYPSIYEIYNTDTISFFVFSTDSLDLLGWNSVRNSYNVLQRYDISVNEYVSLYNNLKWDFPCFPPSQEMRDMKMWPPYGTYDSIGHIIK